MRRMTSKVNTRFNNDLRSKCLTSNINIAAHQMSLREAGLIPVDEDEDGEEIGKVNTLI